MKNGIKFIIAILIYLSLGSCKVSTPNVVYVTKDSIVTKTETVYKDTIITIPGDTIRFQVPCDKDTVFIYRSKSSSSLVQIKNGTITVQNNCDEKDILITKLRSEIDRFQSQNKDSVTVITKREKYVPKMYKFYSWGFWVALGIGGILTIMNTSLWGIIAGAVISIVRILSKRKKKDKKEE